MIELNKSSNYAINNSSPAHSEDVKNTTIDASTVEASEKPNDSMSLTDKSKALSSIDSELSDFSRSGAYPRYFSIESHENKLDEVAKNIAKSYNIELSDSELNTLVKSHLPARNPSLDSGWNSYDFLTTGDREYLESSYREHESSGEDTRDVDEAAAALATIRRREAMIAQGTKFVALEDHGDFDMSTLFTNESRPISDAELSNEDDNPGIQVIIDRFQENTVLTNYIKNFLDVTSN